MIAQALSLFSGILFAIGLSISGMVDPDRVKGFLDVFGQWDPALVFVMLGAIGVNFFTFKYITKTKPLCSSEHYLPTKKDLDKKLIVGSALFGIGWGLIGICPGPGLVNLVTLSPMAFVFVGAMIIGMLGANKLK